MHFSIHGLKDPLVSTIRQYQKLHKEMPIEHPKQYAHTAKFISCRVMWSIIVSLAFTSEGIETLINRLLAIPNRQNIS